MCSSAAAMLVDAAVATGFAMAVSYPRAGNIGGGGFMVIHLAKGNQDIAIDYRETAPAATTRDIFLGTDGKPDQAKSLNSALGIGVPGTVAGLALALDQYGSGKFTLAELLKPAIAMANDGIPVADDIADTLTEGHLRLARWPASAKFLAGAGGRAAARGRSADPEGPRANAFRDRRTRAARLLSGPGRGKAGDGDPRRRRHHDAGRSEIVRADHPGAGARQLPRLRHCLHAAAVVRRRGAAGNPQHPRRLSSAGNASKARRPRCIS